MSDPSVGSLKVAVVQAAPVFLDHDATVEKACNLIAEAGRAGARLVTFPEAFIPGYPDWVWSVPAGEARVHNALYAELLANSVEIPGPATARLCRAAADAGTWVVVGVNERNTEASNASLYNTLIYIDAHGRLLGKHRKLVPTGGERLVWAQGDGSTLAIYDTPWGRLGGLICWENYMPLARYTLYAGGVQLYVAATWARGEPWLSSMRHIAYEGRAFVLSACTALRLDDIPDRLGLKPRWYEGHDEWINVGDSAIVNPYGEFVAGPLHEQEGILYAEVDPHTALGAKRMLDVAGHYARPDVFDLSVNREAHPFIRTREVRPAPETGTAAEEKAEGGAVRAPKPD